MIPGHIGQHTVWRAGDVLGIQFVKSITLADVKTLREVFIEVHRETGNCYLMADMDQGTGIDADARKYMADWSKCEPDESIEATAIYGVSFAMRAILTLTLNAIRFLSNNRPITLAFVKDAAAARAWIDEQRALKISRSSHVGH